MHLRSRAFNIWKCKVAVLEILHRLLSHISRIYRKEPRALPPKLALKLLQRTLSLLYQIIYFVGFQILATTRLRRSKSGSLWDWKEACSILFFSLSVLLSHISLALSPLSPSLLSHIPPLSFPPFPVSLLGFSLPPLPKTNCLRLINDIDAA